MGEVAVGSDAEAILGARASLLATLRYARTRPDLFGPAAPGTLPGRDAKEALWGIWQRVLDCILTLDQVAAAREDWTWEPTQEGRAAGLLAFAAASAAAHRGALDFFALAGTDGLVDAILNDSVPEAGLPEGTYGACKRRFLNVVRGAEFALAASAVAAISPGGTPGLARAYAEDSEALWAYGRKQGPALTARDAVDALREAAVRAWFPVQKKASLALSHLRLPVREEWLITPDLVRGLPLRLRPGDILLQRREWAFTNLGLPGFWTHAALYTGTPAEREAMARDDSVRRWLAARPEAAEGFEASLAARFPDAYARTLATAEDGLPVRVVEALAPGVVLQSLERSAACDGLAVLRPRLPEASKAAALQRALGFVGRPYDFAFDFATDSALVCSELVLKAYESGDGLPGLRLPLSSIAGHRVTPANAFARAFDEQAGSDDRAFDLVLFFDGDEASGRAFESSESAFRLSWRRPKWHVFASGLPPLRPGAMRDCPDGSI